MSPLAPVGGEGEGEFSGDAWGALDADRGVLLPSHPPLLTTASAWLTDATDRQLHVGQFDESDHRAALARRASENQRDDELRARDTALTELLAEWEQS